jgi:PAS domain S-box-containing protein
MRPPPDTIRVLHVDDDATFVDVAATLLEREDERLAVTTATSAREGLDRLAETAFDCIVSDYDMPGRTGIEFLEAVRDVDPDVPFILFTGKGSEDIASDAISAGVSDYLRKGAGDERYRLLANRIENLVDRSHAERRLETRAEQQHRLAELGQEALAGESLETLFEQAVTALTETLGVEYAKVLEYRPERDDLLLRAGVGWRDGLVGEATVGIDDDSQAGYTLGSTEPVVVEDLRTESRFRGPPLLTDHGVVSGLSVLVGSPDDPWGVLGAHTTERVRFTDDAVDFVRTVANILGAAIEKRAATRKREEVFGRISDAFFALDEEWRFSYLNDEANALINPEDRTLEGKYVWDEFPAATERAFKPMYERAMYEQETVSFEEYYPEPLNAWFEVRAYPSETGLSVYFRDVTERRRSQAELERALDLLERTERIADVGGWEIDPETMDVFWTENLFDILGIEGDEEPPIEEAREVYHEDDRPVVERAVEIALDDGESFDIEARIRQPGGEVRWLHVQGVPAVDDGDVVALRGAVQDITEQKEHERELRRAREEYEELLDGMNDSVWVIGTDGEFLAMNDTAVEVTGYSWSELRSMTPHDLDADLDPDEITALIERMPADEMQVVETVHETKGGESVPVEISSSLITYREEPAILSIARDISERKDREKRLERFASIVSHDLRNPLNVAEGHRRLASEECDSESLERIGDAHDRMFTLIDDLLTLARDGEDVSDTEPVDLEALVEGCWRNVSTDGATMRLDADASIRADRSRLAQLFENLFRNAVEHGSTSPRSQAPDDAVEHSTTDDVGVGDAGAVTVTVGLLDDGFYVADDGPGVPAERRAVVFEEGHSTGDGTGFGLNIVEQIADGHGWTVDLTESADGGARFEVRGVRFVDRDPAS